MNLSRSLAPMALAAALLAACGGGDPYVPGSSLPTGGPTTPGSFTNIISFGDSLSDLGTYAPATAIPGAPAGSYFGGRFTTNLNNLSTLANTGKVWVEELATSLSTATVPIVVTPASMGFGATVQACPAATVNAALAGTCTGYSQGGARITDPNGIGKSSGFLTVPLKTQIANHLANPTFGGRFKDSDLIIVFGGHNDILYQLTVFGTAVAQSQAQAQADVLAGRITADQAQVRVQQEAFAAQTAAQAAVKAAALELASYVRNDIIANGGKYVAVLGSLDFLATPRFANASADIKLVVQGLDDVFNLWLREGLSGAPVRWIDLNTVFHQMIASPSSFGLTNVTTPACDVAKVSALTGGQVTDGTSMFCNATAGAPFNTLATGADVTSWLFADTIHPSVKGHQLIAAELVNQLRAAKWIN
ncbi:MAG: SGNH/GDSL hydrolase family protein [Proteobacteria bacterium]|nr:SGNH/GDSL hydrolase family protein [Pseudomonadota bacterium]